MATAGTIGFVSVHDKVDVPRAFDQVLVIADGDQPGGGSEDGGWRCVSRA